MKSIAILLTVHNRKEKTIKCLEKIFLQDGLNDVFEVTVFLVDDDSTDGTSQAIQKKFPQVNIINGNGQLYWNRGMHLAWTTAQKTKDYQYYLWLNDDTIIFPDTILELLNTEAGTSSLVCGAICSEKDGSFTYGGKDLDGKNIEPNGEIQSCVITHGNCVLIPTKVVQKIGILDPIFPHAIGDYDYGLRAYKAGINVVTTLKYVGFCEKNASLPKWCYSTTPFLERIKALYSPLGYAHPLYFYIYEKRHFGFFTAIKHFITIHLRVIFPSLWK